MSLLIEVVPVLRRFMRGFTGPWPYLQTLVLSGFAGSQVLKAPFFNPKDEFEPSPSLDS